MSTHTHRHVATGSLPVTSGAVPMLPVGNAGNGRRQVTIEGARLNGRPDRTRAALGRPVCIEADLLTADRQSLRARAVVVGPSGRTSIVDLASDDGYCHAGALLADELGPYRVRVEAWVDHAASWYADALIRLARGEAGGLTLQRGSVLLFGASLRAAHGDREVLALASKLLDRADDAATLATDQIRCAVELASRHPDIETVTAEHDWHELLVQPPFAAYGSWCTVPVPRTAAADVTAVDAAALTDAIDRAGRMGFDVACVDLVHPEGEGLHAPDDASRQAWRELAARAHSAGAHLAVRLSVRCGSGHRWRTEAPWWFRHDRASAGIGSSGDLDFETPDWGGLWQAIESVFVGWLDAGVDAIVLHEPNLASLRFWDWVLPALRRRSPDLVIACTGDLDSLVASRLRSSGVDVVFAVSPPQGEHRVDAVPRRADPEPVPHARWTDVDDGVSFVDWVRAIVPAAAGSASYATPLPVGAGGAGEQDQRSDLLVRLHAWRHRVRHPLLPAADVDPRQLVVLEADEEATRAVILPAGTSRTDASASLGRQPWTADGPWIDLLGGTVVESADLTPDAGLPARLLVPLTNEHRSPSRSGSAA